MASRKRGRSTARGACAACLRERSRAEPAAAGAHPLRGAELPWSLPLEGGETATLRALFLHSSEEEQACWASRAKQLARAEEALARIEPGLGGHHYPDRASVGRRLAQLLTGTPGRFLRAQAGGQEDNPTLRFWRDEEAIRAERAPGRDLLPDHERPRAGRCLQPPCLVQGADARRAHPPQLKGPLRVSPLFLQSDARSVALIAVCAFALLDYTLGRGPPLLPGGPRRPRGGKARAGHRPERVRAPRPARARPRARAEAGPAVEGPAPAHELLERLAACR